MKSNFLFISRFSHKNPNSKPDIYSILDACKYGLEANIDDLVSFDYYDLYFDYGANGFKQKFEEILIQKQIKYLYIAYGAEDFTIDLNFLYKMKQKYKLCIINTLSDPETFFENRDRYYNQLADYLLPFTPTQALYENYGINTITLYSVYNKSMFKDLSLEKTIDVSFIGNVNKANRREYIDYLKDNGINIQTYGNGSDNGFINHEEMMKVINSSKINLNFTESSISDKFDFNSNTNFTLSTRINSRIQQAKGRLTEIYLTNSFCLSEDGPGTRALIDDNRIIFTSKEDLVSKIQMYLQNTKQCDIITQELHKLVLQFDAKERFKVILPQLIYTSKNIKKLYIDKDFIKNYTTYHSLFFFNFLFKRKIKFAIQEIKILLTYKSIDIKSLYYHLKMQTKYAYMRYRKIKK